MNDQITLYSVRQVADQLAVKPHVIRNHMRRMKLGKKIDWSIVLTPEDVKKLKERVAA